jgi:hypothetical protein
MSAHELILDAALAAAEDLSRDVLALPMDGSIDDRSPIGVGEEFVSVALVNDTVAMQIGFVADRSVFTEIARPMLGLEPSDPIAAQDVVDATSEAVNIMAGNFKTRIDASYPSLRLGLPLVTVDNPRNEQPKWVKSIRKPITIGSNPASLVVALSEKRSNS